MVGFRFRISRPSHGLFSATMHAMASTFSVLVGLFSLCLTAPADLLGIPTVPFTTQSDSTFDISSIRSVTVDERYASATDEDGWTLIPPTLQEFASTFADDLREIAGCHISVDVGQGCGEHGIFITTDNSGEFADAAGRFTSEGYRIDVTEKNITITGASPLGAWWGTRTVLQQAVLNDGTIAIGSGTDAPGWGTRGVMLDGGRHYCRWNSDGDDGLFDAHLDCRPSRLRRRVVRMAFILEAEYLPSSSE